MKVWIVYSDYFDTDSQLNRSIEVVFDTWAKAAQFILAREKESRLWTWRYTELELNNLGRWKDA